MIFLSATFLNPGDRVVLSLGGNVSNLVKTVKFAIKRKYSVKYYPWKLPDIESQTFHHVGSKEVLVPASKIIFASTNLYCIGTFKA